MSLSLCLSVVSAFAPSPLWTATPRREIPTSLATRDEKKFLTVLHDHVDRRDFLSGASQRVFLSTMGALTAGAAAPTPTSAKGTGVLEESTTASTANLLADLPMIRLKLPRGGFGREYVAIKIKIQGNGPYEFMLDTGLTIEFITPHLQQVLGIEKGSMGIEGLAAGGSTFNALADLKGASLCCGDFPGGAQELPLPLLRAVVTDFPQEHIDPAHDPVEGMIGMELLSQFDVDFDFPNCRLRLYRPGTAAKEVKLMKSMVEIPAVVINETGLLGIRLTTLGSFQPILAFLDCGSTFSAMNWKAAGLLGLPTNKSDALYKNAPAIQAIGIDGRPLLLPIVKKQLTFAGDVVTDPTTHRPIGFASPPPSWKPWNTVQMAVGDIPAFQTILGDGVRPFQGPAALLGLDVLAQRRVILEAGPSDARRRRIFVSES
jgi:Aspartyl protease